jgi:spore germination cell wall hydrolase CwlJ-like protein
VIFGLRDLKVLQLLAAAGFVTFILLVSARAAEISPKAKTAERKAEVLEEEASGERSGKVPPAETITKSEAEAVDPSGKGPLEDPVTCLARSIYWESRGDDVSAMEAIANVIMNRLGYEGFPDTVCGVVKEGREKGECQFSWWCDGRSDSIRDQDGYGIAKEIARKALNRQLNDRTHGALYFHHQDAKPAWSKVYRMTAKVGKHLFYKPVGNKAK